MGIHAQIPNAHFAHTSECKNPKYTQLLFVCFGESGGIQGMPSRPNMRITLTSDDVRLSQFESDRKYNLKVNVEASQPNDTYKRASVSYNLVDFAPVGK